MEALDLTTIIISVIGLIASIVSCIVWVVKTKQKESTKQEDWERNMINETIDKLVSAKDKQIDMLKEKCEINCKSLKRLIKEFNSLKKKLGKD